MDEEEIQVTNWYNCKSSPDIKNSNVKFMKDSIRTKETSRIETDLSNHHRQIEEEFEILNPSASRKNQLGSLDRNNQKEDSFGPYKNSVLQNCNNGMAMISPSTEHRGCNLLDNQNSIQNNQPFLTNFALSNKRGGKKKFLRCKKSLDKKIPINNVADSIECPQTSDYCNNREQFSSLRRGNAYYMSAMRSRAEEDCDIHNSNLFKSVQYNDQMQSLDCSQLASNYSLHMRKLMGKLQKQLEDEVITRTRKIESMLDK